MTEVSAITSFEPGVFIQISDVMTGVRKLARVTETGASYIDLDADDCTPLPIYTTLEPVEAGNILGWGLYLIDTAPEQAPPFKALCDRLINSGEGVITYNRAAYWAFQNRNFDFDKAIAAAKEETSRITTGRNDLDSMIKNAGSTA